MNFYLNRNIKWSCGKCDLPWLFLHKYGCINVFFRKYNVKNYLCRELQWQIVENV